MCSGKVWQNPCGRTPLSIYLKEEREYKINMFALKSAVVLLLESVMNALEVVPAKSLVRSSCAIPLRRIYTTGSPHSMISLPCWKISLLWGIHRRDLDGIIFSGTLDVLLDEVYNLYVNPKQKLIVQEMKNTLPHSDINIYKSVPALD
jgi:hypothetical protein